MHRRSEERLHTTNPKHAAAILNDADEYRSASAFIVLEEARWDNLVKIARADDIKTRLGGILKLLEDTYRDRLRGMLPPVYGGSSLDCAQVRLVRRNS